MYNKLKFNKQTNKQKNDIQNKNKKNTANTSKSEREREKERKRVGAVNINKLWLSLQFFNHHGYHNIYLLYNDDDGFVFNDH